jgi:hypothetical protein
MRILSQRVLRAGLMSLCVILLASCASETVLLANFTSNTVGAPPLPSQEIGTVAVDAGAGSVLVATPPPGASGTWVEIRHPAPNTPQTALQGRFAAFRGDGTYGLLAVLFIPSGCGVVTLQFEPFANGPTTYLNFLHLDFMPNNTVRLDDNGTTFGTFPRDQFFTVSVSLKVGSPTTTAQMHLFGAGASGDLDYNVLPIFGNLPRQFGGVRFWMGFQHAGAFKVDEIIVTYKKP